MNARFLALRLPHLLAQVEMIMNPALRGRAFVVATSKEPRAQVMGRSPETPFVCNVGAPLASWLRLIPDLSVIESRPECAIAMLTEVRARLGAATPVVASPQTGQFILDFRGCRFLHPDLPALSRRLLNQVRDEVGLLAAGGLGPSPLAAQLLARRARTGELASVCGEDSITLDDFPLEGLPGVSSHVVRALAECGVRSVGSARALPVEQLRRLYGVPGLRLRAILDELDPGEERGGPPRAAPLLATRRLRVDTADPALVEDTLYEVLEELHGRTRDIASEPRRLILRLTWNDGQLQVRTTRLQYAYGESRRQTLRRCGRELLAQTLIERRLRVRELAVELIVEAEADQLPLFAEDLRVEVREQRVDRALGQLRGHWGADVVRMGFPAVART